ncbi:hypothetical protein VTJ04DRAFT_259 [Mycothermus thermophilus]|uniref:uncharacterized protein n=1 Tax=Humicola insolens TaxID=85995 RepID=UPI003743A2D5
MIRNKNQTEEEKKRRDPKLEESLCHVLSQLLAQSDFVVLIDDHHAATPLPAAFPHTSHDKKNTENSKNDTPTHS